MQAIHDYYDKLAPDYDRARFGNSYGRYIDRLERRILRAWLAGVPPAEVLDIGCGTGRLLDFAQTGVDCSAAMLEVAASKFPGHRLIQASSAELGAAAPGPFQAAICFHLLMHLDREQIEKTLQAAADVVRVGGRLIIDIPSQHRRSFNLRRPNADGWHGNTAATQTDIARWSGPHWRIVRRRGVLLLPIHRLPSVARPWFAGLDRLLGRTPLARYASYHVYALERLA